MISGEQVTGCDATVSQWAKVVVTGTHESGALFEIAGRGMVGYDERGFTQGHFYKPPKVRVLNDGTAAEDLKEDALLHGAVDRGLEADPLKH